MHSTPNSQKAAHPHWQQQLLTLHSSHLPRYNHKTQFSRHHLPSLVPSISRYYSLSHFAPHRPHNLSSDAATSLSLTNYTLPISLLYSFIFHLSKLSAFFQSQTLSLSLSNFRNASKFHFSPFSNSVGDKPNASLARDSFRMSNLGQTLKGDI